MAVQAPPVATTELELLTLSLDAGNIFLMQKTIVILSAFENQLGLRVDLLYALLKLFSFDTNTSTF